MKARRPVREVDLLHELDEVSKHRISIDASLAFRAAKMIRSMRARINQLSKKAREQTHP